MAILGLEQLFNSIVERKKEVTDSPALMPMKVMEHGGRSFLLMLRLLCLADVGQTFQEIILREGLRLRRALEFMHSRNLIHADIRSSNIFVTMESKWYLSDFGSSLKIGEEITSSSAEMLSPEPLMFQVASPRHDWMLLLVLLAAELEKKVRMEGNILSGLTVLKEKVERVDKELVIARIKSATLPALQEFLSELQDMAWPTNEVPTL